MYVLYRDLRSVSDWRRSPRPSNRGETTVTQTTQSWCYYSRLPLSRKKNREERESGRRRSTRRRKLSRKVTNSDCHSAQSHGWRRSGVPASEVINQHTSWSGPASQSLPGAYWSVEEQRCWLWEQNVCGITAGKTPYSGHIQTQRPGLPFEYVVKGSWALSGGVSWRFTVAEEAWMRIKICPVCVVTFQKQD